MLLLSFAFLRQVSFLHKRRNMRLFLEPGMAIRAADPGEARARVAVVEVTLDDLLDDRPKIPALSRFAPEDCKACTLSRNGFRTQRRTHQSDGTAPDREQCVPGVGDDRLPPWREKGVKKRAKVMNTPAPPWKDGRSPDSEGGNQVKKRPQLLTPGPEYGNGEFPFRAAMASRKSLPYLPSLSFISIRKPRDERVTA